MAKLNIAADVIQQGWRWIVWSGRRTIRQAVSERHRLGSIRILLLLAALGLSLWLTDRCVMLRDQSEHTLAASDLVLPHIVSPEKGYPTAILMAPEAIPELLGRFDSIAREAGLRLERIDYRKEMATPEKGDILRINTTLIGNTEKVLTVSASLMETYPGLALAALKLMRNRVESVDGEAQLTWMVFLKPTISREVR